MAVYYNEGRVAGLARVALPAYIAQESNPALAAKMAFDAAIALNRLLYEYERSDFDDEL